MREFNPHQPEGGANHGKPGKELFHEQRDFDRFLIIAQGHGIYSKPGLCWCIRQNKSHAVQLKGNDQFIHKRDDAMQIIFGGKSEPILGLILDYE
jgi:hypothetical protein